jgi:hypothetical protein
MTATRVREGKRKPYLDRAIMRRAMRLLNMQYKPGELADELGVSVQVVYKTWIPAGCPHERDAKGQLWMVGSEFRAWAESDGVRRRKGGQ